MVPQESFKSVDVRSRSRETTAFGNGPRAHFGRWRRRRRRRRTRAIRKIPGSRIRKQSPPGFRLRNRTSHWRLWSCRRTIPVGWRRRRHLWGRWSGIVVPEKLVVRFHRWSSRRLRILIVVAVDPPRSPGVAVSDWRLHFLARFWGRSRRSWRSWRRRHRIPELLV